MDEELRYRAELADQFLGRLSALTPSQWRDFVAARASDQHYYAFALELADEATRLLGDERRAPHERILRDRLVRVDAMVNALALPEEERGEARRLAHAAIHACLVRDALGFNPGGLRRADAPVSRAPGRGRRGAEREPPADATRRRRAGRRGAALGNGPPGARQISQLLSTSPTAGRVSGASTIVMRRSVHRTRAPISTSAR